MNNKYDEEHRYDDMLDLPHPVSRVHPPMPVRDRAAQFAPFAALTGHSAAIRETQRLTDRRIELSECELEQLDQKLQQLIAVIEEEPEITITYFSPDEKKSGGSYRTVTGIVKGLNQYKRRILLDNGDAILIDQIYAMTGDCFEDNAL